MRSRKPDSFLHVPALGVASAALLLFMGCQRHAVPAAPVALPGVPRIVSLAPNLTEMICAVGCSDRLVGRTDVCNYPANLLTNVPIVAGFGRPYLEPMLLQKPTLVLDADLEDKSLGAALERMGIGRQHIECRRLADIPPAARAIGRLTGRSDAGSALARLIEVGIRSRRAAVAAIPLAKRPSVYVELWCDPAMTVGRDSFVSELIALAGGRNLGDELPNSYGTVSSEWVLTRNPDIIICLYMNNEHRARQTMQARLGWQTLRAVQNGRVYDDFNPDSILRPGPRVLEGVEQLRRVIAADDRAVGPSDTPTGTLAR